VVAEEITELQVAVPEVQALSSCDMQRRRTHVAFRVHQSDLRLSSHLAKYKVVCGEFLTEFLQYAFLLLAEAAAAAAALVAYFLVLAAAVVK
jgi:uncharacterized membrane protein